VAKCLLAYRESIKVKQQALALLESIAPDGLIHAEFVRDHPWFQASAKVCLDAFDSIRLEVPPVFWAALSAKLILVYQRRLRIGREVLEPRELWGLSPVEKQVIHDGSRVL
jgi:hypothetical protein